MKIAISVPDPVFKAAELLARNLKKSRSELYSEAVQHYVKAHGENAVRDALNAVYSKSDSTIDPELMRAQLQVLGDETW